VAAKRATNRRYSDEFKADAVRLLATSGRSIAEVARELGVTDTSLGGWARDAARKDTPEQRQAVEAAAWEAKEIARLRKRARDLEQEIEILKRFTAYWVRSEGDR
jgi:transposase